QYGATLPAAVSFAAGTINTNERETNSSPSVNFSGLEGWRLPSLIQRNAKTGASRMTHTELTDCHHEEGNEWPSTSFCVSRSAKSEIDEPLCSKIAQKISAAKKKIRIAA